MSSFKISKLFALKSSVRVMYFIILLSTLLVFNLNEKLSYFAYSLLLPHFLVKFPLKRLGLVEIMYVVFVCLFFSWEWRTLWFHNFKKYVDKVSESNNEHDKCFFLLNKVRVGQICFLPFINLANLNWYLHSSTKVRAHGENVDYFSRVLKSMVKIQNKLCG